MPSLRVLFLLPFLLFMGCSTHADSVSDRYLFFLHNRFLEEGGIDGVHPEYGKAEYREIINEFTKQGFTVISELRPKNASGIEYAKKVVHQIDSLLARGVAPSQISVIGTSKGGYIAKFASSFLKNKDVNFVFIGCCDSNDVKEFPDVHVCGNILSIYEDSDTLGRSCQSLKDHSTSPIPHYAELVLHNGRKHGFLYKALPEWIEPAVRWAKGNYDLAGT